VRTLALAAVCLLTATASAGAEPPPPPDLGVDGGQEDWRPSRVFRLFWTNPPANPAVSAVHYRVRSRDGATVIGPVRLPWPATDVDGIEVPARPGAYAAEVWLEDAGGRTGAAAAATLRFDDRRPGETSPLTAPGWVGRTAFPLPIRLARPERVPLSGIRGYAVSVSSDPARLPCAVTGRCTEAEVDLDGGIEDDTYAVRDLPEGTSYLRAVSVSGSGVASVESGPVALRVDTTYPTTTLRGAPGGWANRAVEVTATAADGGSGMLAGEDGARPFTAISVDGAPPVTAAGASVRTTVAGEGTHRVAYYARDLAGNVDDGGSGNGVANPSPRTALVRIDRTAPLLSFANDQQPGRPELIRARVTDPLSGPDGSRGWIGVRRLGSGDRFAPLPARPAPIGELHAHWDSEAYPDGEYEFRAVGFDRAGNSAATRLRASGGPMVLSNPLKEKTDLVAGLGEQAATRQTVAFGDGALVRGRLTTGSRPLASKPVEVVERYVDGKTRVSSITTGPGGNFALRLPAGPSREVGVRFAGDESLTRAASRPLELEVRGMVRMRTSARTAKVGGAPLVFAGRVGAAAGTIPPEGKTVELQFRLPGLPWREFRTIRTDRRGRFRYPYRFSDDDSRGARFLFRAYAPAQGGWPYEPAGSRPVAVRGR
ncbi:MAG TPA: hypothetical protein VEQ41_00970, partial [Solirubrobacterales bacterium]|nr:hypothetical protein [Solirubrobacterales bacterium]